MQIIILTIREIFTIKHCIWCILSIIISPVLISYKIRHLYVSVYVNEQYLQWNAPQATLVCLQKDICMISNNQSYFHSTFRPQDRVSVNTKLSNLLWSVTPTAGEMHNFIMSGHRLWYIMHIS